jgi:tripartite ATP-independent transporter DctM subunit
MERELIGVISIIVMIVLLLARMPVAVVMIVLGMGGIAVIKGMEAAAGIAASTVYATFASYSLVVVPLFTWMGFIGFHSGISEHLYEAAYKLSGRIKGGLAMATTLAAGAFGAICGSTTATSATFATLALPEMRKRGYDVSLATANIAASGILGVLIPPSVIFIVYASITAESVASLFIAGIFPGMLLAFLFIAAIYVEVALDPKKAPPGESYPWKVRIVALFKGGIEVIIIFGGVIGGLLAGLFTGTEAGSIGCFATLLVVLARRALSWKGFVNSLKDTVRTSTMVMFLVAAAAIFGEFLGLTGIPVLVADWVVALPLHRTLIMVCILIMLMAMGCFVDALAMVLLVTPIFYPSAILLGFDGIWFGVIMTLALGMGVLTPPVGANVYVVYAVAKDVPVLTIFKGVWPYLIALWICCLLLLLVPQIALYLPSFMK